MKILRGFVFAFVALAGCSAGSYSLERPTTGHFASLSMASASTAKPFGRYNGIKSVDGQKFSSEVGSTVFVRQGRRAIGYHCPGWIYTDGGPTLMYEFRAGIDYILDCNGTPSIRVATGPS